MPKLTLITHKAYGEGFEVMCSKHVRADFNFAWPAADITSVAPDGSLDRQDLGSPYEAAVAGHLDDVIEPVETRPRLIAALGSVRLETRGAPAEEARQHSPVSTFESGRPADADL